MKWVLKDCQYGDMIRVRQMGELFHYGIYVSDEEIIQFGYPPLLRDKDKDNIVVVSTDIDTFSYHSFVEVAEFDRKERKETFTKDKIVENARGRIGEGGYNILHNNCEHFTYECVFGIKYSSQEDMMRKRWQNSVSKKEEQ